MKINEAKSKFVYPEKLYARTNDNITLDISYAPQTMEAVEYVRTNAFVEKATNLFEENLKNLGFLKDERESMVNIFKKAMKI